MCFQSKYDLASGSFFKLRGKYNPVRGLMSYNVNYNELPVCGNLNLLDLQTRFLTQDVNTVMLHFISDVILCESILYFVVFYSVIEV